MGSRTPAILLDLHNQSITTQIPSTYKYIKFQASHTKVSKLTVTITHSASRLRATRALPFASTVQHALELLPSSLSIVRGVSRAVSIFFSNFQYIRGPGHASCASRMIWGPAGPAMRRLIESSEEHFRSIRIGRARLGPPCLPCSAGPCRLVDGTFAEDGNAFSQSLNRSVKEWNNAC